MRGVTFAFCFLPFVFCLHADDFQQKLTSALYGDGREVMILRREMRLAQLPPAPAPPTVTDQSLVYNPIDQFIVAKWPPNQKAPVVCEDVAFLRRAYLDVIGVIPTVEETKRFLSDRHPASGQSWSMSFWRATKITPPTGLRSGRTRSAAPPPT